MNPKHKPGKLVLPALKCRIGDRPYIVTAFSMRDIADRVKKTDEVHSSKQLAEWIQRNLDGEHAARIAAYLVNDNTRMFSALVLGVYGGHPEWAEMRISDPREELTEEDEDRMTRSIGVLVLSGSEKLFAIDGQHRVAGIKKALELEPSLGDEEVSAVIIGHDSNTQEGRTRTRRLFITLNQTAKKVSDRDFVALSEDNGLAVVTRQMIDDYDLFKTKGVISFAGTVKLPDTDEDAITSILGLFQIVKALYPRKHISWPRFSVVQRARPDPDVLKEIYDFNVGYWKTLIKVVPEYKAVLESKTKRAGAFRKASKNHLLFRPVGQLAFARATQHLMSTGKTLSEAVTALCKGNTPWLTEKAWHHILWDPGTNTMINKWLTVAETVLLTKAGFSARSLNAAKKLDEIRKANASG